MSSRPISLTYKWTAKPGNGAELRAIYDEVGAHAERTEPGMLEFASYPIEGSEDLLIHEVFADADAVGAHLQGTAAEFFPRLMAVATPGPFFFRGELPDPLKQALRGMDLGAVFASEPSGFSRDVEA